VLKRYFSLFFLILLRVVQLRKQCVTLRGFSGLRVNLFAYMCVCVSPSKSKVRFLLNVDSGKRQPNARSGTSSLLYVCVFVCVHVRKRDAAECQEAHFLFFYLTDVLALNVLSLLLLLVFHRRFQQARVTRIASSSCLSCSGGLSPVSHSLAHLLSLRSFYPAWFLSVSSLFFLSLFSLWTSNWI
jgi:hypothetical protein